MSFRAGARRVSVDVGDSSALAGFEPRTSAFAALSPTNRAHEHILPTYLSYSISAGGKNATLTTKRKNTIVALRIPKAEMGITLLIAVAKNAIMVVNDVTLMAEALGVRDSVEDVILDVRHQRALLESVVKHEDVVGADAEHDEYGEHLYVPR